MPRPWPFGHDATGVMAATAVVVALIYGPVEVLLATRYAPLWWERGAPR